MSLACEFVSVGPLPVQGSMSYHIMLHRLPSVIAEELLEICNPVARPDWPIGFPAFDDIIGGRLLEEGVSWKERQEWGVWLRRSVAKFPVRPLVEGNLSKLFRVRTGGSVRCMLVLTRR